MKKAAVIGSTHCLKGQYSLCPLYESYDILIVNYLTNDMLAKSALGLDTPIVHCLSLEIPVVIINDGVQYKKVSNVHLFKMYDSYAKKLKSFGVRFVDDLSGESVQYKRLITAEDISVCNIEKIEVPKNTIITPAAYDLAKEKKINIVRNELI